MDEFNISFETWLWMEHEKKRAERNKRVRETKAELLQRLIIAEAILRDLEIEQRRKAECRRRPLPERPKPAQSSPMLRKPSALVRDLGLADKFCYRSLCFERGVANGNEISLTVSSDVPYERSFGKEILDHSPGSIRMDRMIRGAPLLFNHSRDKHLGRILSARTDGSRMSINAKFGRSALAQEKL